MNKSEIFSPELSVQESLPGEIQKAAKYLEEDTGLGWQTIQKIASNERLRKAFEAIALYAGLVYGGDALAQDLQKNQSEADNTELVQLPDTTEANKELIEEAREALLSWFEDNEQYCTNNDKGLNPGIWKSMSFGDFLFNYYSKNKEGEIDYSQDKFNFVITKNNVQYYVQFDGAEIRGHAFSHEVQPESDFQTITKEELFEKGYILGGEHGASINYKDLSTDEIVGFVKNLPEPNEEEIEQLKEKQRLREQEIILEQEIENRFKEENTTSEVNKEKLEKFKKQIDSFFANSNYELQGFGYYLEEIEHDNKIYTVYYLDGDVFSIKQGSETLIQIVFEENKIDIGTEEECETLINTILK